MMHFFGPGVAQAPAAINALQFGSREGSAVACEKDPDGEVKSMLDSCPSKLSMRMATSRAVNVFQVSPGPNL